jgi:hypothetical protein
LEVITMRRWTAVSHTVAFGVAAAALLAVACDRPERLVSSAGKPMYWFGQACPAAKMTGGGRIDYPPGGPDKNPPASHEYETFGAHVISGGLDANGNCQVKGQLEWVDHRDAMRVNGSPLNLHSDAITFVEVLETAGCSDGALHWGGTLEEQNTGQSFSFEVFDCDNGEPGVGHDGFEINVPGLGYAVMCEDRRAESPPLCVLTGGNRQFHS